MKKLCFILMIILTSSLLGAGNQSYEGHYIGFGGGMTTGNGLMYRYHPNKWGVQFAFLPIISAENTFISGGTTGLCTLFTDESTQLFLYLASSGSYTRRYDEDEEGNRELREYYDVNIGSGPGFNIYIFDHITLSLMGGYGIYNRFQNNAHTPSVNFTFEGSILYRW